MRQCRGGEKSWRQSYSEQERVGRGRSSRNRPGEDERSLYLTQKEDGRAAVLFSERRLHGSAACSV